MKNPLKVVGFSGSLRAGSHSKIVLHAMRDMLPEKSHYLDIDCGAFPLYNQDLDGPEKPDAITESKALVQASDMVLIVLPEYNHGIPGVLKNAIDWLSRPAYHSCFFEKPVLFATVSGAGVLGGVRAQSQMRETLASLLCTVVPMPEIVITRALDKVDGNRLTDVQTLAFLREQMNYFTSAVDHLRAKV